MTDEERSWNYKCYNCDLVIDFDEDEVSEECPDCGCDMENIGDING